MGRAALRVVVLRGALAGGHAYRAQDLAGGASRAGVFGAEGDAMTVAEVGLLRSLRFALDVISPGGAAAHCRFDETSGGGGRPSGEFDALWIDEGEAGA